MMTVMRPILIATAAIILIAYLLLPKETLRERAEDILRKNTAYETDMTVRDSVNTFTRSARELTEQLHADESAAKLDSTSPENSAEPTTN